jgi:hypothetical protein
MSDDSTNPTAARPMTLGEMIAREREEELSPTPTTRSRRSVGDNQLRDWIVNRHVATELWNWGRSPLPAGMKNVAENRY